MSAPHSPPHGATTGTETGGRLSGSAFDVLLFDIGGVLVHFAGFEQLPRLLPGTGDPAAVRERWIASPVVHAFERGDIDADEFAHRFLADWRLEISAPDLLRRLASWVHGPYPGATEILDRLRPRFRIACLSNSNALHTHLHREALRRHVDALYFSNEIGRTKPDPGAFAFAIRNLAVAPDRIAYFDDTAVNVEAAAASGMNAHLTDGLDELAACLRRLDLL